MGPKCLNGPNPREGQKGVAFLLSLKVLFFFSNQPTGETLEFEWREAHFPFSLTCNNFSFSFLSMFVFFVIYVVHIVQ